jgi:peptide/nickel transport system permease protein
MLRQVTRRLAELAVVLFGVSIIVFLMIRLIPGDAVTIMLGANTEITADRVLELRTRLGLDQPLIEQYLTWLGAVLHGDLGNSLWTGRPVTLEILDSLWPTLELTLLGLVAGAGLAVPLGCLMAQTRGRRLDIGLRIGAIVGLTIPSFWLGILMLIAVSVLFPTFPSLGYVPFSSDPLGNLARMVLPVFAVSLSILANLSRLVRSAMLDALGQDYVRTARAKGAPERTVVYKHALRNALIPFVTSVGILTGYLLGGAIVVEQVFAIPGIGRLILAAIADRNYPLIQATILIVTVGFVAVNFVVDLLYRLIDPRIEA